jgi:biotin transport system substrate-specific component
LLGFVLAAAAAGYLAERGWDRNLVGTFALMVLAASLIYLPGLLWLGALFGADIAITKGFLPFILGDLLKIALATVILPVLWKIIR